MQSHNDEARMTKPECRDKSKERRSPVRRRTFVQLFPVPSLCRVSPDADAAFGNGGLETAAPLLF
jgi:hypothetical protein